MNAQAQHLPRPEHTEGFLRSRLRQEGPFIRQLQKEVLRAAKELRFEDAARLRDQIKELEEVEVTYL